MSALFAANLSSLRREKNITQKNAAESLGVSQALLSHYEKGIRECNLDFVIRAAEFYDVTADYLLGISSSRHGSNEIFDSEPLAGDSQIKSKTVLRSLILLHKDAEEKGEDTESFFSNYFSLAIKKYLLSVNDSKNGEKNFYSAAMDILDGPLSTENSDKTETETPLCVRTIENHAEYLLKNITEEYIK